MPASRRLALPAAFFALPVLWATHMALPAQETPVAPAAVIAPEEINGLVEIAPGTLPLILLAPHGGNQKPKGFAARTFGKVVTDANTIDVTRLLVQELEQRHGARPTTVISLLHRSRLDPNREIKEAAQGDPAAIAVWERYHAAANEAVKQVTKNHGLGLLLDIHGHRHEEGRVEVGMLLNGKDLALTDEQLNASATLAAKTSIRELDQRSPQTLAELVRGKDSLGGLLEARGYPSIPSPAKPRPGDAVYFSGSYDVSAHGSRDQGTVSAIQIECPWDGVRDTPENRAKFVKELAGAIDDFFRIHYGRGLSKEPASEALKPGQ